MDKPLIFHFKNEFTIVLKKEVEDTYPITYRIGVAFCHPKDQFCRRIGRQIAEGRADNYVGFGSLEECMKYLYTYVKVIELRRGKGYWPDYVLRKDMPSFIDHVKDVTKKMWGE